MRHQRVRPSLPGSYEAVLHAAAAAAAPGQQQQHPMFALDLRGGAPELRAALEVCVCSVLMECGVGAGGARAQATLRGQLFRRASALRARALPHFTPSWKTPPPPPLLKKNRARATSAPTASSTAPTPSARCVCFVLCAVLCVCGGGEITHTTH